MHTEENIRCGFSCEVGVFETSVLQAIRNDSCTDPDFTQVNNEGKFFGENSYSEFLCWMCTAVRTHTHTHTPWHCA